MPCVLCQVSGASYLTGYSLTKWPLCASSPMSSRFTHASTVPGHAEGGFFLRCMPSLIMGRPLHKQKYAGKFLQIVQAWSWQQRQLPRQRRQESQLARQVKEFMQWRLRQA